MDIARRDRSETGAITGNAAHHGTHMIEEEIMKEDGHLVIQNDDNMVVIATTSRDNHREKEATVVVTLAPAHQRNHVIDVMDRAVRTVQGKIRKTGVFGMRVLHDTIQTTTPHTHLTVKGVMQTPDRGNQEEIPHILIVQSDMLTS